MISLNRVLLIFFLLRACDSLKILVYSPAYAASHTNYMARLADTLTEAGHNVTFFTPIIDVSRSKQLGVKWTKDVLVLEQDEEMKRRQVTIDDMMEIFWTMDVTSSNGHRILETMHQQAVLTCGNLFRNKGIIEELRSREFDVALAEPLMTCGLALFKHLGIEKTVITSSCVNYDVLIPATGESGETSYLPSMNAQVSDEMDFAERLENHEMFHLMLKTFGSMFDDEAKVYREHLGEDFPDWKQLIPDASLHLVNAIPFIDFPRPHIQKTIGIGGISVDLERIKSEKLSSEWEEILNLRERNMFISFGTLARSTEMPKQFKDNLLSVISAEPNVTFIWKYESDDIQFGDGVENLIFTKWMPQTALLSDKRVNAFLGHGGLGSTNEAIFLGKPAIMIPIFADQSRNSNMLARHEMAITLHKRDLGDLPKLRTAFHEILYNDSYRQNAERLSEMVQNMPLKPKELAVKYIELVGKYGPFHHMTPHSLKMPWYQRYNYDIYAYKVLLYVTSLIIFISVLKFVASALPLRFLTKSVKME